MDENLATITYRLGQIEKRSENFEEEINKKISELYIRTEAYAKWQAEYGVRIDTILEQLKKVSSLVEALSEKPVKRLDSIIAYATGAIIGLIVSALVYYFKGEK